MTTHPPRKDSVSLAPNSPPDSNQIPVLGRLMRGTFWLALKTPIQMVIALWQVPLTQAYIGTAANGAYFYAWNFGFIQFLLEFGMGSALQKQVVDTWTRGDREGFDRALACGMKFYAWLAAIQMACLLAIAYVVLPYTKFRGDTLVIQVLWIQILTAPFFGASTVVGSVLQAARRYEFIPRLELVVVVLRFAILGAGIWFRVPFIWIVAAQVAAQIGLSFGPAAWVMVVELGIVPRFRRTSWSDFAPMLHISLYMALMQLSVVLADKVDTTILGFALPDAKQAGPMLTVYQNVSKPFMQIRQMGWTLAYLVMPAVVSLAVAKDRESLDRIKYDGTRLLIAMLLPISLLAGLYAAPFLTLWVGVEFAKDAGMMQLFLVATLPLMLSVLVQMAIGMGKIKVVALSALAGALVNLPLSYVLTRRMGVVGVIWGTVLTTLFSNLLVPGLYVGRVLEIRPAMFFRRTLGPPLAGALALVVATWAFRSAWPPDPAGIGRLARALPLLANLSVGCLAYAIGYGATAAGRADYAALCRKLCGRRAPRPSAVPLGS
ncbi:polysaccharide biosynthesis C-terminal domain-containing protein [Tundrisphaera sp. TA3]|uniref:polysaccharide biosynthesis protein n=1 Tax=Tundrisphaera sp. TA3 TaxID=3435775 RepID=UPI003EBBCD89